MWLPPHDETIRSLWPDLDMLEFVLVLFSRGAIQARAKKIGCRKGTRRRWTEDEKTLLRDNWMLADAAELGRRLRRTTQEIYREAHTLRLPSKVIWIDWPKYEATIRRRHAQGWSDAEIAAEIQVGRRQLSCHRRRCLGLVSNRLHPRQRALVRERTRLQLQRQMGSGGKLADLRYEAHRKLARESGWPEDLRLRETQIMNALWERGPMTRREIAEAIGMPWKGPRNSLHSNAPEGTYLATLMKRGLVVGMTKAVKIPLDRPGRGNRNVNVYMIPLHVSRGSFQRRSA